MQAIPRLGVTASTETLRGCILLAFQSLGNDCPMDYHLEVIQEFVCGKDVFVVQPTGSGKSLCFVCLPYVFSKIHSLCCSGEDHFQPIVLVISPLISLMKDQVQKYSKTGIKT